MIDNRKVEAHTSSAFWVTNCGLYLKNAHLRQNFHAPRGHHEMCKCGPLGEIDQAAFSSPSDPHSGHTPLTFITLYWPP
jgi:hypothetical protein